MIYKLIQENTLPIMSCICIMFFLFKNNSMQNQVKRYFWCATITILVLIIADAWEGVEAAKSHPEYGRTIASVIGYWCRPLIAYFICRAALKVKNIRFKIFLIIPVVINIVIVSMAFFSPIVFSYDEANQFVRGPLGFITFVTGMIYIFAIAYISVTMISKENSNEAGIVIFITIILVVATLMESMVGVNAILSGGSCLGIVFYYMYLNINISEHDVLTGAKVRRNFYLDAERTKSQITAVISMDLNGLKALNDNQGHWAGDKALVTLAETVRRVLPQEWEFYRTGGDEFMILCYKADVEKVKDFIYKFNKLILIEKYEVAIGYEMYSKEDDFEKTCQIADAMMYENKRKFYLREKKKVDTIK